MQAQEVLRQLRFPELEDFRHYMRGLPTNALMGMGAFAAFTTYWLATRPKALKPPCDLGMQSVEMPCPGDADRLDQRVRDRTGLLTAVNFSTGKDMPERHDSASPLSLRVKKNIQEEN